MKYFTQFTLVRIHSNQGFRGSGVNGFKDSVGFRDSGVQRFDGERVKG